MNTIMSCWLRIALGGLVCLFIPAVVKAQCSEDTPTGTFRTCLTGSASSCSIPTGTHVICSTLLIDNANLLTIEGGDTDAYDTVLQRGFVTSGPSPSYGLCSPIGNPNPNRWPIMCWVNASEGLYIQYLTFDGNRWNFGTQPASGYSVLTSTPPNSTCLEPNIYGNDLDLEDATIVTVWYVNFIRAADGALDLGGATYVGTQASTVDYSNFGESTASYASRSGAVSSHGTYGGAYYNDISYQGTAAIDVNGGAHNGTNEGNYQIIYGNTLYNNRYEMSDGIQGGQLYVDPDGSYESIATNIIDGDYWYTTPWEDVNGCQVQSSGNQTPYGIEAYGQYNSYYNNEVYNQASTGIQFGDGNIDVTLGVYISGSNPWDSMDTYHYVTGNSYAGIIFTGGSVNTISATLDGVRVCYTGTEGNPESFSPMYGIYFAYTDGTGFINGATMSDNSPSDVGGNTSSLTNGPPGSPTLCPAYSSTY